MDEQVSAIISRLDLKPHPEGGFFRELFRSTESVQRPSGTNRVALTAIYYLLASGQHSRWHQVASDEQWTFLDGGALELLVLNPADRKLSIHQLGPSSSGLTPVAVVPAGHWQAARTTDAHSLVTCTVGPGFDYSDFKFLGDSPAALTDLAPLLGETRALL